MGNFWRCRCINVKCKILSVLLVAFYIACLFSISTQAQIYTPQYTNFTVDIDNTTWSVFTRDNISKYDSNLNELGLDYDYMYRFFYDNDIYLDAIMLDDNGISYMELCVIIKETGGIDTYDLDGAAAEQFSKDIAEEYVSLGHDVEDYDEYFSDNYSWITVCSYDNNAQLYVCDYLVVVNGNGYTFKAQKQTPFNLSDKVKIENVIDSVEFDVKSYPITTDTDNDTTSLIKNKLSDAWVAGLSGGIIAAIVSLYHLIKKKKDSKKEEYATLPDKLSYTDEQIRSFTSSYNSAFRKIKDYNNDMIIPSTLAGNDMLYKYVVNSFYICLGWCVFHADTAKKKMVLCEIDRFVDNLEASAPENLQGMTSALKFTYRNMGDIMLRYKRNNIDPSYQQDSSKENYNNLISEFLEYVCKISKIEWYDGIVDDFKHCMDD